MARPILFALFGAAAAALSPVQAQSSSAPSPTPVPAPYVRPSAPGQLVDIGGRRLHVECKGDASGPTVIFEAGLSQYTAHSTYGKARDLIAAFARVCTYDRAGLGWSDAVAGARTHDDMVADLHRLVAAGKLKGARDGRLILVGHSMGGLLARRYASVHPADVAALILVDATPEATLFGPGAVQARQGIIAQIDKGLAIAKPGVPVVAMPAGTSTEVMLAFTPEVLATVRQEYAAIDLVPDAMRGAAGYGTLGALPLTVIRRGRTANPPNAEDEEWRTMQEALARLSTRSLLVVAQNAGHVIPYDQPEVVADAVRRASTELSKR